MATNELRTKLINGRKANEIKSAKTEIAKELCSNYRSKLPDLDNVEANVEASSVSMRVEMCYGWWYLKRPILSPSKMSR